MKSKQASEQEGAPQSRSSTYGSSVRNISNTSVKLQKSLRQGLACSFVDNHEEVQHQHKPYPSHQKLYNKATSAVLFNGSIKDWFRTTVGVRKGCLLSPTLFNIFLERIISDALEDHEGTVSIGGRTITNLRFADDIVGLAGEEERTGKISLVFKESLHSLRH